MEEEKQWWKSRTIWFGIATGISGILTGLGILPTVIDATIINEIVTGGLALATVVSRIFAKKKITTVPTTGV
jgi:hypothetical protein